MDTIELLFEALMDTFSGIYANEAWLSFATISIPILITLSFVVDVMVQDT